MKKWILLTYGLVCYAGFGAISLCLAGWLGNLGVPQSIDAAPTDHFLVALVINLLLVVAFALQHSVMARPAFKRWWTQYVPEPAERSTYVLLSCVALALLIWQWRPMGGVIWEFERPSLIAFSHTMFVFGWLIVVGSSFSLNHFDLFGLRQVWLAFRGQPYQPLPFRIPGPYRLVRHPLYVGWLVVFWSTPTMTIAHLLFAAGMTAYLLIAMPLEERDLIAFHGSKYREYQQNTRRLIPKWQGRRSCQPPVTSAKESAGMVTDID